MKPSAFRYHAPTSIDAAIAALDACGDDAVVMAGGQSLMPLLNLRLAAPTDVIDLRNVARLADIVSDGNTVHLGAMVTHHTVESHDLVRRQIPLARCAASHIGFRAIRNRGTVGGSVGHADPAAEWPMVLLALDGSVTLRSSAGVRDVAADKFFVSLFTTVKRPGELLTAVSFSSRYVDHWGFSEFQRRTGDFAVVAAAVACRLEDSVVSEARVVLAGIGSTPIRCVQAEATLTGREVTPEIAEVAAQAARDEVEPIGDIHGSPDYRRRLVYAEVLRAVTQALRPAQPRLAHV